MKCPNCKFENLEGSKFCNECGIKLEIACPKCGKANQPGSKFCNECGHQLFLSTKPISKDLSFEEKLGKIQKYLPGGLTEKILAQRGKIEGERKQVTVMLPIPVIPATQSGAFRPPVPIHSGRLFRRIPATPRGGRRWS